MINNQKGPASDDHPTAPWRSDPGLVSGQRTWAGTCPLVPTRAAGDPAADHRLADLEPAAHPRHRVWVAPQAESILPFMAWPKLPWDRIWALLWRSIPQPLTDGRLLLALDDSLNPKTGKKVFACERTFDPAAKTNQNRYLWAQTLVTVGCYGSSTVVGPACPWPSPSTCVRLRCAGNSARSAANSRSSPPGQAHIN
jgi:hypothetical protein